MNCVRVSINDTFLRLTFQTDRPGAPDGRVVLQFQSCLEESSGDFPRKPRQRLAEQDRDQSALWLWWTDRADRLVFSQNSWDFAMETSNKAASMLSPSPSPTGSPRRRPPWWPGWPATRSLRGRSLMAMLPSLRFSLCSAGDSSWIPTQNLIEVNRRNCLI